MKKLFIPSIFFLAILSSCEEPTDCYKCAKDTGESAAFCDSTETAKARAEALEIEDYSCSLDR